MHFSIKDSSFTHYYGHIVRRLFIAAGVVMILTLSFFHGSIPVDSYFAILSILTIAIVAGLTGPLQRWSIVLNALVAIASFVTFEENAVYRHQGFAEPLFWIYQSLALLFFFAFYFAVKSVRFTFFVHPEPSSLESDIARMKGQDEKPGGK